MYEKPKGKTETMSKENRNKNEPVKGSAYVLMHVTTLTHTPTLYIQIYGYIYASCIHMCMHYRPIYKQTHMHHMCVWACVCVCECVYAYIYIYIFLMSESNEAISLLSAYEETKTKRKFETKKKIIYI